MVGWVEYQLFRKVAGDVLRRYACSSVVFENEIAGKDANLSLVHSKYIFASDIFFCNPSPSMGWGVFGT